MNNYGILIFCDALDERQLVTLENKEIKVLECMTKNVET